MRGAFRLLLLLALVLTTAGFRLPTASLAQAACLAPAQALAHAGERVCVEGTITQATYAQRSNGQPTFLDFGPQFTAVIWGEDRPKFSPPLETLRGRQMRVSGTIESFRGKAEIIVRDPQQLSPAGGPPPQATATRAVPSAPSNATTAATAAPVATSAPAAPSPPVTVAPTQARVMVTAVDAAVRASSTPAVGDSLREERDDPGGGASKAMVAVGLVLVALGGAGGAWYRLRRR